MGAGAGHLTRPNVFRILVAFTAGDGKTAVPLPRTGEVYQQFEVAINGLIRTMGLDATWTANPGTDTSGGTLLIRGTSGNGNIDTDTAVRAINCNVDTVLRGVRVNQHNGKQETIRRSTGVSAVVTHNIGPAPSEQSSDLGQVKGPCRDCCQDFRVTTWDSK